jgi:hypothetical protein
MDTGILANAAFLNQIMAHTEIFENGPEGDKEHEGRAGRVRERHEVKVCQHTDSCPKDGECSRHTQKIGDRGPAPHDA